MPSEPCFLRFWGVRGSIPAPGPDTLHYGGNTSCVEIRADGEIIILDAGTGIRALGLALGREVAAAPEKGPLRVTLLVSHMHWDHIQGFPYFLPAYDPESHVHLRGYNRSDLGLRAAIAGQMTSPYFPIAFSEMRSNVEIEELREMEFSVGKVGIKAFQANHPGGAVGYRFATSGGSIVYMPDNEPYGQTVDKGAAQFSDLDAHSAQKRAQLVEFVRDADLLLLDSQYTREEYFEHLGWGHGYVDDVVDIAVSAGVKQLRLFHHDPDHSDEVIARMAAHGQRLAAERGSSLIVEAAREGETVTLAG